MQTGFLDNQQIERLIAGVRSMNDWSIHIDDTPGALSWRYAQCRRIASDKNTSLGMILIDYLQLMRSPSARAVAAEISNQS